MPRALATLLDQIEPFLLSGKLALTIGSYEIQTGPQGNTEFDPFGGGDEKMFTGKRYFGCVPVGNPPLTPEERELLFQYVKKHLKAPEVVANSGNRFYVEWFPFAPEEERAA